MIPNLLTLTISGDTAVPLIDPSLLRSPSAGANSVASQTGYSLLVITSAPLHIGNADVTRVNTDPLPAGSYGLRFNDDEVPYGLVPSGQTVTVKRLGQGFKAGT